MQRSGYAGVEMLGNDYEDQVCSVANTLEVVGERWSLLIVREIFLGVRRFDEIQADLGVARNVLQKRLTRLVELGVLERRAYQERPLRCEYRLTQKGQDLYPIMLSIMTWGDRYKNEIPPVRLIHRTCGHDANPHMTCASCGEELQWREMTAEMQPDAWLRPGSPDPVARMSLRRALVSTGACCGRICRCPVVCM